MPDQRRTGVAFGRPTMKLLGLAWLLGWTCVAFGAEESCEGRCEQGFDPQRKCQCDALCLYYQSCCADYGTACKAKVTRGDVFLQPEDDYLDYPEPGNATDPEPTGAAPETGTAAPDYYTWTEGSRAAEETVALDVGTQAPTLGSPVEPEATEEEATCSGKPFDAFTSAKNGSVFAFRGKYVYELDETSVRPGYPKHIQEVWGIEGPVDVAFTRVNCQGKTYLFKGGLYWRFADGLLEPDFPRNISDGFVGIPDHLDAAFALPAQNYFASERVYFFKGAKYWSYDFANQPSREDCDATSPSAVFGHYAHLQANSWEDIFQALFGGNRRSGASRARFISRDWRGLPGHLDAALLGRLYVAQSQPAYRASRRPTRRQRKKYRRRQTWGPWDPLWDWQESSESSETGWLLGATGACQPFQSVYFFVGDKYYRLNLRTRRVDWVFPKYPRPVAKYWLGCPSEEDLA